jgi:hypothetical protein
MGLFIFIVLFLGLHFWFHEKSGWRILASRFRARSRVKGQRFRFEGAVIGREDKIPLIHRGTLFFTVNEMGFGMSVYFLFRFGSPMLFIPWSAVESVSQYSIRSTRLSKFRIRDLGVSIIVARRLALEMSEQLSKYQKSEPTKPIALRSYWELYGEGQRIAVRVFKGRIIRAVFFGIFPTVLLLVITGKPYYSLGYLSLFVLGFVSYIYFPPFKAAVDRIVWWSALTVCSAFLIISVIKQIFPALLHSVSFMNP